MAVHLIMFGWTKSACGIKPKDCTNDLLSVTCANCQRYASTANVDRAWQAISLKSARVFYLQRAGIGRSRGLDLVRSVKSASKRERAAIKKQIQTNPDAARAMAVPVAKSAPDQRSRVMWDWHLGDLVKAGRACPKCGGMLNA